MLLAGWFFNWRSVEHWADASSRLDDFLQTVVADYHSMQLTANVRLEASLSRALPQAGHPEDVDSRLNSYRLTWRSPEVRQRWLARAANDLISLDSLVKNLEQIDAEFDLNGGRLLEDPKERLKAIRDAIGQAVEGRDLNPSNMPIPELENLSLERSQEIEGSLVKAADVILPTHAQFAELVSENKKAATKLYNTIFAIGTFLTVFSKFIEWRQDLSQKSSVRAGTKR